MIQYSFFYVFCNIIQYNGFTAMTLEAVIISLADFDIKMIVACDYDNHVNFLPIPSFLILQSSVILFVV